MKTKWVQQHMTGGGTNKKYYKFYSEMTVDRNGWTINHTGKSKIEKYENKILKESTTFDNKTLAYATLYKLISDAWQQKLNEELL